MFCRYCGSEMPEDSVFCKSCGKDLSSESVSISQIDNSETGKDKKQASKLFANDNAKRYIVGIVIGVLVLAVIILGVKLLKGRSDEANIKSLNETSEEDKAVAEKDDKSETDKSELPAKTEEAEAESKESGTVKDDKPGDEAKDNNKNDAEAVEPAKNVAESYEEDSAGPYGDEMYELSLELESQAKANPVFKDEKIYMDYYYDNGGYWFVITHDLPENVLQWYEADAHYADELYSCLKEYAGAEAYLYGMQCELYRRDKGLSPIKIHVSSNFDYSYSVYIDDGWNTYDTIASDTVDGEEQRFSERDDSFFDVNYDVFSYSMDKYLKEISNIPIAN